MEAVKMKAEASAFSKQGLKSNITANADRLNRKKILIPKQRKYFLRIDRFRIHNRFKSQRLKETLKKK